MAQKKTVIALVFGVFMALVMNASVAQAAPSRFNTQDECEKAVTAGRYEVYPPRYFGNHKKNPVDGVTRIAAATEFVACVHMKTMTGKKEWVVQAPGTMLRFNVTSDGSLTPYARHDCGNEIDGISYPQAPPPEQPVAPAREERKASVVTGSAQVAGVVEREPLRDVCAERGLIGENFVNKIDERGQVYCAGDYPWYKWKLVQYPAATITGGAIGYSRAGLWGAVGGGLSGITGTYLGREIAGEGNEEWGLIGIGTGAIGGLLVNETGGGSSSGGGGGTTGGGAPSGGGSGI